MAPLIRNIKKRIKTLRYYHRITGYRGIVAAITSKLTNSTVLLELHGQDCQFSLCLRIPSSDIPTYQQIFIMQEYDFLVESEPKVIIDAGANIGLASIYFTNKYPAAKIIAIEPEKSNFELLIKNTAPYANIIPVQAALWNINEEVNLIDRGAGKWGFITEQKNSTKNVLKEACHTVRGMTIDNIIKDYRLTKIDILKMDIEGAEKEVFSNPSHWIAKVDTIIVELHERIKKGCNRTFHTISNGFETKWIQGENVYLSRGNCKQKIRDRQKSLR